MKETIRLLELCKSKRVQGALSQERKKIETELNVKRLQREHVKRDSAEKADATVKGYTVKISNYGMYILRMHALYS